MDMPEPSNSNNGAGFDLVASQRGKSLLLRAGYKYDIKQKNKDGSTVWRCVQRSICKAILITTCANLIKREDNHACEPDTVSNEYSLHLDNRFYSLNSWLLFSYSYIVKSFGLDCTETT